MLNRFYALLIIFPLAILLTGCPVDKKTKNLPQEQTTPKPLGTSNKKIKPKVQYSKNIKYIFYKSKSKNKKIALTFDDGPDNIYTTKILKILKTNHVKATFFIIGNKAEKNVNTIKSIIKDGNAIGNHSWSHANFSKLTPLQINNEVSRTEALIYSITSNSPGLFRPPYGAASHKVEQQIISLGYRIIYWSVDTRDWAGTSPDQILKLVKKETKPGSIILFHCSGIGKRNLSNTERALPQVIKTYKSKGYNFVTIPELIQSK